MGFEIIATIIFFILLSAFLFYKRKYLTLQKVFFPFLYMVLYKSSYGLDMMELSAKRFKLLLRIFGFLGVIVGFLGMAFMSFFLVKTVFDLIFIPKAVSGVALVVPFPVSAPGFLSVPFFYWIISIFILAVIHEFSHGAMARVHNVHVKSTGFAFLGIIIPLVPAAFVEPDEKILKKKTLMQRLSVFAAGAFANILLAGFIWALLSFLIIPAVSSNIVSQTGVEVYGFANASPAEQSGIPVHSIITKIDNVNITTYSNFTDYLNSRKPGDKVVVMANESSYNVKIGKNPLNESKPYMGIYVVQNSELNKEFSQKYGDFTAKTIVWFVGLLIWLYILNLGIGLFNLLPMGPIDGGRMMLALLGNFMEEQKANKIWGYISIFFFLVIIASLVLSFMK